MTAQVFISYAHADNQIFDEDTPGWVSSFVDKLQKAIGTKPGDRGVECWMDYRLEQQRSVDDELRRRIRESKCIVAFMSPCYLKSEWCQKEMNAFVESVSGGSANDRVFLVEILPTNRDEWHKGIQKIGVAKFWSSSLVKPTPKPLGWPAPKPKADEEYWDELNRLADILARQIQSLPSTPPVMAAPSAPACPSADPLADKPLPPKNKPLSVVINADQPDRELGKQVQDMLVELDVDAILAAEPQPTQKPADYRQHLEAQLGDSHGVLIVYGNAPPSWVQAQYARARKVLFNRIGIWGALLDGPPNGPPNGQPNGSPEQKPDHGIGSRNFMLLNCRSGVAAGHLQEFVAKLGQEVTHV